MRVQRLCVIAALTVLVGAAACETAEIKDDEMPKAPSSAPAEAPKDAPASAAAKGTQAGDKAGGDKAPAAASADHSKFDALLGKYVTAEGRVNYKGWKASADDMKALDEYVAWVETADASKMEKMDALAFWINGYNAITIQAVLARYPDFPGVLKVDGFFDKVKRKAGGAELTLNDLEKTKIREPYGEPRIHFVVNCASGSCPVILPKALTKDNLEASMEAAAKKYVLQETKLSADKKTVDTSHIFDWYADDFKPAGGPNAFLAKYMPEADRDAVKAAKLTFHDYDWTLNEAK